MNVWGLITGVLILVAAYIHHGLGTRKNLAACAGKAG